ncbi:MAG: SBBP repeat-containing protein [Actinomycetota bacterium]|nr:SBBP repeat-containing protein [Actinomycetota bacterium]
MPVIRVRPYERRILSVTLGRVLRPKPWRELARTVALAVVGSLALLSLGAALPAAGSYPGHARGLSAAARDRLVSAYGRLPLSFEPNRGQANRRVRLIAHGAGYALGLTDSGALLALDRHSAIATYRARAARALTAGARVRGRQTGPRVSVRTVAVGFVGESPRVRLTAGRRLPGRVSYLIGNDRRRWQTNIPTFSGAIYRGVWPGIDATFTGSQHQLEYVFDVAPGADPRQIRLAYHGQSSLRLDAAGNLILTAGAGHTVCQLAPRAYQLTGGRRRTVTSRYVLTDGRVTIKLGAYDHHRALVIDPTVTLAYSTYLGGSDFNGLGGDGIAVDSAGDAYVTGDTTSTDFPTHDPLQPKNGGGENAFVAKLNPAGSALLYSTYLGGSGSDSFGDSGQGIAVDSAGDAYVTGYTTSLDFPTHDPKSAAVGLAATRSWRSSTRPARRCSTPPTSAAAATTPGRGSRSTRPGMPTSPASPTRRSSPPMIRCSPRTAAAAPAATTRSWRSSTRPARRWCTQPTSAAAATIPGRGSRSTRPGMPTSPAPPTRRTSPPTIRCSASSPA